MACHRDTNCSSDCTATVRVYCDCDCATVPRLRRAGSSGLRYLCPDCSSGCIHCRYAGRACKIFNAPVMNSVTEEELPPLPPPGEHPYDCDRPRRSSLHDNGDPKAFG
eukprot:903298-Prorocentrum_minimum.AAC.1